MQGREPEHVSNVVPMAVGRKNIVVCKKCGQENDFSRNQWRRVCSKCGMHITLPWAKVERVSGDGVPPACFACMDRGLVFYESQEVGMLYKFVARCTCSAAPRADYPTLLEASNIGSPSRIEYENRRSWEEKHGEITEAIIQTMDDDVNEQIPF